MCPLRIRVDSGCLGLRAAATSAAAQRGQRAHGVGHFGATTLGHSREHGDCALGGLLTIGAVSASSAHGLEFVKLMVTGRTEVFVQRHVGNLPGLILDLDNGADLPRQAGLDLNLTEANMKRQERHYR